MSAIVHTSFINKNWSVKNNKAKFKKRGGDFTKKITVDRKIN